MFVLCFTGRAYGQHYSVRGNALLLATGTINAGISYDINTKWQVDLALMGNPIKTNSLSLLGFVAQPGVRYWLSQTNYSHFFSGYLNAGGYDLMFANRTYKGFTVGLGVGWGYYFPIKKRLNIGVELGVGLLYTNDTNQNVFTPDQEDHYIYKTDRIIFAPTKLEFCVVYLF